MAETAWRNRIVGHGEAAPAELVAHPLNARRHPTYQRQVVKGSLDEIGWIQTVIVSQRSGRVVDGHLRVEAALERGEATIPVVYVDLTEAEEAKALATLDPSAALAVYDAEILDALLRQVDTESAALQRLCDDLAKEAGLYGDKPADDAPEAQVDKAEELRAKWGTERGQLWVIPSAATPGRAHRLLCGDSTDAGDVARLMGGERAALLATDPPYNVGKAYGNEVDDAKLRAEYEAFSRAWFSTWQAVSERQIVTPGCVNLAAWCQFFEPYHVAPWTKTNSMTNGKVSRFWCWEPVLFYGDKWPRGRSNDVFDFPIGEQGGVANHPCPKPLKMWLDLLENYSDAGDIVAEAFNGSGTTMVAAEQTGRVAYGMEISPAYTAVALQRLADLGLTPELCGATV